MAHDGRMTKRQELETLRAELEAERSSFSAHWRELSDYIMPRRARFFLADANRGDRRTKKILDSTGTTAARTLAAMMSSNITSPARPWFRLTTPYPDLNELGAVKAWLHDVSQRMVGVFLKSNVYNTLPILYGDMGTFATGAMFVKEAFSGDTLIHTQALPIGSYMIGTDSDGRVNTFIREFRMTVSQLVLEFGGDPTGQEPDWTRFSQQVRALWENSQTQGWIDVVHVIRPNPYYQPDKLDAKYKKYESVYYERGSSGDASLGSAYISSEDEGRYLRESGFDYFPVLVPRWETTGEDIYGTNCPGMTALGDIKQLQTGEKRSLQGIEKTINPPMTAPTQMRTQRVSSLPSDVTYLDIRGDQRGFQPAYQIDFRVNELEMKQEQLRQRIRKVFYEDLFLMLATLDRRQITAREIEERHEEKLLALGPVLERLNKDMLEPLIDITFSIMLKRGFIPRPPEELQGIELKVEYLSVMAQAQKLVGLGAVERFAGFAAQVAQLDPQVLDKIDRDQLIDEYAEVLGIPPRIVVPDEEVEAVRAARAQMARAQQAVEMAQMGAKAAKDLAASKMGEDNALDRLTREVAPAAA